MRCSGVLCPVFSLASRGGIGGFSKEAYEFVDFLTEAGQTIWQVLPMGPTGFGDSPYQSFSTYAGNPYFIPLDKLVEEGLLTEEEIAPLDQVGRPDAIDYAGEYGERFAVLRKAFARFDRHEPDYEAFVHDNESWLEPYAAFTAIKASKNGASWDVWEKPLRDCRSAETYRLTQTLSEERDFIRFQQYEFMKNWLKLKTYANKKGIRILGDIPFYAAADSADVWANPDFFQLDDDYVPTAVAGCPPDAFSEDGQLWGNPLYRWDEMARNHYAWWISRLMHSFKLFDIVRVDHFRGFAAYYSIPYGSENARHGEWVKGPGLNFFREATKVLGDPLPIVAEDLGVIDEPVRELLKGTGFPGMKVLHFAFSGDRTNEYLPHNLDRHAVMYTGTHDNDTTLGWIEAMPDWQRDYVRRYTRSIFTSYEALTWDFIRMAESSVCDTCIIPIQDLLVKDSKARINLPGTSGRNWRWRMVPNELSHELAKSFLEVTDLYGRVVPKPPAEEEAAEEEAAEEEPAEEESGGQVLN